ncbi:sigma-54-dependent Fis family transcriptional regulator [bacterium]|nr:sigma-54-dependent Fis family transcriptional regulator [bacterium]
MKKKILVVDDQEMTREFLSDALSSSYNVDIAIDKADSIQKINNKKYDLVLTDIRMNTKNEGIELLKTVLSRKDNTAVIVMTGYSSVEQAIEAMRIGAYDYIEKPFTIDEIQLRLKNALNYSELVNENKNLRRRLGVSREKQIIGSSPKLNEILETVDKIAPTRATILITGKNGTGKELIARRIHAHSNRSNKPFVRINCAAIPEGILESELFGHEKGSFTSADKWHPGKFEQANEGTLLLDEIAEIPLHIQAKLLRVLQEREINRVGGNDSIPVDVRIISTTNKNLLHEIKEGKFREDLYYRLNVVNVKIPPLRERREDILKLANHFIDIYCLENGKKGKKLSAAAIRKLQSGFWRGNIRELENSVERAVILCDDDVLGEEYFSFDENITNTSSKIDKILNSCTIADAEKIMIFERLGKYNDNRTKAANDLGISVRTLRNKLKLYNEQSREQKLTAC